MRLFQENKHEHTKAKMHTNRHMKQIHALNQSFTILNIIKYTTLKQHQSFPILHLHENIRQLYLILELYFAFSLYHIGKGPELKLTITIRHLATGDT